MVALELLWAESATTPAPPRFTIKVLDLGIASSPASPICFNAREKQIGEAGDEANLGMGHRQKGTSTILFTVQCGKIHTHIMMV